MSEVVEEAKTSQIECKKINDTLSSDERHGSEDLTTFHFKLPIFEGPLDLLLHLIRENKIDIYDIPIVDITRQYLVYIELMKELNLEVAGEFLVMAATLIHIKSRMLLPPDEEEKDELAEDPRADLVKRLLEHQAYKESSLSLRKREEIWKNVFHRDLPDKNDFNFEEEPLLVDANVFDLLTAFQKLLEKVPTRDVEITRETLTVTDKINYIVELLENEDSIRFEDLFADENTRITLIVTFLALLEIVRLGLARIYQEKAFGLIWILRPRQQDSEVAESPVEEDISQEM